MKITINEKYSGLLVFFILLLVNWISNYSGMFHFGLYEDDYWYAAIPMNSTTGQLFSFLGNNITDITYGQGRFIGMSLPLVLIHFIYGVAGFKAVYIVGMLLVTLNAYLIFAILRKNYSILIGILAAILFLLFPADTTRPFLCHIYLLHLSMLFVLVAFIFYEKRLYFFSYLFALFSLLSYESTFLPFIFAPFLVFPTWNRELKRLGLKHMVVCAGLIVAIFIMRKIGGEERVATLSMVDFAKKTLASSLIGPVTVMFSMVKSSVESLLNILVNGITILIGTIGLFLTLLYFYPGVMGSEKSSRFKINLKYFKADIELNEDLQSFLQLFLVSTLMLLTAYLFSYTHYPPTVLKGRMTSVHFAASIGGAIFIANILYFIILTMKNIKMPVLAVIAVFLALLMGYSNIIQKDYKKAWQSQKSLWKDVSVLASDAEDNTLVLISKKDLDSTSYIISHSWSMPSVFNLLYQFPSAWKHPPKLIKLNSLKDLQYDTALNSFFFIADYPFLFEQRDTIHLEDKNVIFLEKVNNDIVRKNDSLMISNHALHLKPGGENILGSTRLTPAGQLMLMEQ